MRTKVSTKGQIVLPGPLRRRLNICAGDSLDISVEENRIVLTAPERKHFKATAVRLTTSLPIVTV